MSFTIGRKLGIVYSAMVLILIVITLIFWIQIQALKQKHIEVMLKNRPALLAAQELLIDLNFSSAALRGLVCLSEQDMNRHSLLIDCNNAWQRIEQNVTFLNELSRKLNSQQHTAKIQTLVSRIRNLHSLYAPLIEQVTDLDNQESHKLSNTFVEKLIITNASHDRYVYEQLRHFISFTPAPLQPAGGRRRTPS